MHSYFFSPRPISLSGALLSFSGCYPVQVWGWINNVLMLFKILFQFIHINRLNLKENRNERTLIRARYLQRPLRYFLICPGILKNKVIQFNDSLEIFCLDIVKNPFFIWFLLLYKTFTYDVYPSHITFKLNVYEYQLFSFRYL